MFCMNCGQKLPDEAKFCFRCGSKVCIEGIKKAENEKSVFEQDMPDEFPEEHWSDEEKLAFAESVLKSDYKVVRRYCEGKKLLALDESTKSDVSDGTLYRIDYDRDTILHAFSKYFQDFHRDGGKRIGEGQEIGYIGHIFGPGRGPKGKILLRQEILKKEAIRTHGRYQWESGDDELYTIFLKEVYKLNLEVSENEVSVREMKLEGEVQVMDNQGFWGEQDPEFAKIKEWSSVKDENGLSGCVILFYEDKPVSVMKGVLNNAVSLRDAWPFSVYQNFETQDLSEVTQSSNLGFKIAQMARMNLLHYKYGTIIDFSMLQIGVFVRELNRKTQYFIRTADKRKYPDVGIKDCQYYEFEDGELKPIDFEKLKKYQNSEHQVRWMAGSIKYQHENIFS